MATLTLREIWQMSDKQLTTDLNIQGEESSGDIFKDRTRIAQIYSATAVAPATAMADIPLLSQRESEYVKHPRFTKIMETSSFFRAIKQLDTEIAVAEHLDELGLVNIVHQFNHQVIVATGDTQGVTIWDVSTVTAKVVIRLTKHLNPVRSLLQLADGTLAIGCANGKLVIWDYLNTPVVGGEAIVKNNVIRTFHSSTNPITNLTQLSDGNLVVSDDISTQIWNINIPRPKKFRVLNVEKEGLCLRVLSSNSKRTGNSTLQLHDGRIIGGIGGALSVWDLKVLSPKDKVICPSQVLYVPSYCLTQLSNGDIATNGVQDHKTITNIFDASSPMKLKTQKSIPFLHSGNQIETLDGWLLYMCHIGTYSTQKYTEIFEWNPNTNETRSTTLPNFMNHNITEAIGLSTGDILISGQDIDYQFVLKMMDPRTKEATTIQQGGLSSIRAMVELF
jgi:hypothetical protein